MPRKSLELQSVSAVDPRPARRQARFDNIVGVAWSVAAEQGLAGLSLHEVARRVGLRQPSLYAYIDSKSALYDAMFSDAARRLLDLVRSRDYPEDSRQAVRESCLALLDFAVHDPVASQLLFERTIPGFEPSPGSYAYAQEFWAFNVGLLEAAGVTDPGDVDMFTALVGGLFNQQQTNEPGGDRWIRHLDTVLEMLFAHVDGRIQPASGRSIRHGRPASDPRTPESAPDVNPERRETRLHKGHTP